MNDSNLTPIEMMFGHKVEVPFNDLVTPNYEERTTGQVAKEVHAFASQAKREFSLTPQSERRNESPIARTNN